MATLIYKNCNIFIDGYDLSTAHSEITLNYSAEMQDETSFGDETRINKGGLEVVNVTGSGFWENAAPNLVDDAYFGLMGTDDKVVSLYANGITDGESAPGGFAFKGVISEFSVGGGVGELLTFNVTIEGRGIEA
jgi:hypothetical protein